MVAIFLSILIAVTDFFGMGDDKKKVRERTFLMIKPDAVQRGLVGEIIGRFEKRGYTLVAMKMKHASVDHMEEHYADHKNKGFFRGLVDYMASGPVVAMVWEGDDVVAQSRKMLGATHPRNSDPGTIRGDLAIDMGRNIMHGSDSVETAKKEIELWFSTDEKKNEIVSWKPSIAEWLYE